MKKLLVLFSIVLACSNTPNFASAETWYPEGAIALANVGTLKFSGYNGHSFYCELSGSITSKVSSASIGSLTLSGGFLNTCNVPNILFEFPLEITGNADGTVTISDFYVYAHRFCFGDLTGSFNQSTGEITFDEAELPNESAGGLPCTVSGTISTNPQLSFTTP